MTDKIDDILLEILIENEKQTPREIHAQLCARLNQDICRAVVWSRLVELTERGYFELLDSETVDDCGEPVFVLKLSD